MKITKKKYVITTKGFPIEFDSGDGNRVDDIEYANFYDDKDEACICLKFFDEPEEHQVITVNITYEF